MMIMRVNANRQICSTDLEDQELVVLIMYIKSSPLVQKKRNTNNSRECKGQKNQEQDKKKRKEKILNFCARRAERLGKIASFC